MKKVGLFISIFMIATAVQAVPMMINYQGKINVDGTPFTGSGDFKFAIVDDPDSPTVSYWSNDGSSSAGSEPTLSVSISVNNGLYNVVLGETDGMDAIDGSVFSNDDLYLRVWFDDGTNGFQRLAPDQRLTSAGFSFRAETADDAETVDGMEGVDLEESAEIDADISAHAAVPDAHHSKTTSFTELSDTATDAQIPDDITVNYASTSGDADTLDGQDGAYYDDDQPDDDAEVPDNITIDNSSLYAPAGGGDVGIGTTSPQAKLHVEGVAGTDGIMFPDGTLQTSAKQDISCRVHKNGINQSVISGDIITFDAEDYDTDNMHDTSTNTGRITINTPGKYCIWGQILNGSNNPFLDLKRNGLPFIRVLSASTFNCIVFNFQDDANTGDYYELVYGGSSTTVNGDSQYTRFGVYKTD
ncbi:hypothetical protein JW979_10560 [bacterium]|nr:hypothetical protein [candidate division CSSED10-310 bacterium]